MDEMRDDKTGRFLGGNPHRVQEGNTKSLQHGADAFRRTGKVPAALPWAREIEAELDTLRADLVRDLGGEDMMTTGQAVLLDQIVRHYGYCALIDRWVLEKGSPFVEITDRKGKVIDMKLIGAISNSYLSFHAHIQRNLERLGLHKPRSFDAATPLEQYMKGHDEKEKD